MALIDIQCETPPRTFSTVVTSLDWYYSSRHSLISNHLTLFRAGTRFIIIIVLLLYFPARRLLILYVIFVAEYYKLIGMSNKDLLQGCLLRVERLICTSAAFHDVVAKRRQPVERRGGKCISTFRLPTYMCRNITHMSNVYCHQQQEEKPSGHYSRNRGTPISFSQVKFRCKIIQDITEGDECPR